MRILGRAIDWLLEPDASLRAAEKEAEQLRVALLLETDAVDEAALKHSLELVQRVEKVESERETNLNGRGTTVATVAGLIVALASGVAKPIFSDKAWTGEAKQFAVFFFAMALPVVAAAMVTAVVGVLRPQRGGKTKNFLAETVVDLWKHDSTLFTGASSQGLRLLDLDRALRTLPVWHYRNRNKARWLRRSYMLLMAGTTLLGVAGFLVLAHYSRVHWGIGLAGIVVGTVALLVAIKKDWLFAVRQVDETPEYSVRALADGLRRRYP